ncbi:hypothetical protein [Janthinobacterium sp. HH107]|uniref:hypothetical protein n=1 Tax=Janthinobacterium sp. HH107 TaxID=1537279 RepID=UPI00159F2A27|nr:hypothetical protein [Janthinobacterium sp. HH107]
MKHASELTAAQIEEAKKLYISYFGNSENPAALAALIQTLALNYATTVAQKI